MNDVKLKEKVSGERLEEVCIKAAKELGYKAKSEDAFSVSYELGSVHPHREYNRTHIRIRNIFPVLQVRGIIKGKEQSSFCIWKDPPYGFASEEKVQKYLSKVSELLG